MTHVSSYFLQIHGRKSHVSGGYGKLFVGGETVDGCADVVHPTFLLLERVAGNTQFGDAIETVSTAGPMDLKHKLQKHRLESDKKGGKSFHLFHLRFVAVIAFAGAKQEIVVESDTGRTKLSHSQTIAEEIEITTLCLSTLIDDEDGTVSNEKLEKRRKQ